ncbi:hypothetical protein IB286_04045 [Spongiibacter sp. KMU-158]|uniref:DNA polymerase III subunit chi n=1 Tax=Spongiibacter pelagi TaxID=2760804 RepID=A0A927GW85_9GAMM|nr:hypothetical protein [Spongiibacter pelagi]MBD2858169.1 hypothetical protein [Spongiibacter pelagi]
MLSKLFGRKHDQDSDKNFSASRDNSATDKPLLNELEDLQQALHASPSINPESIPVLDDIIESGSGQKTSAADSSINEDTLDKGAVLDFTPETSNSLNERNEEQLDQLIQELMNELMPTLEAQLKQKLIELVPRYLNSKS